MNGTMTGDTRPIRINPVLHPVYRLGAYLFTFALLLENWRRRQQLSSQLAHVDPHTLHDAGISDAQRFISVNHPFD